MGWRSIASRQALWALLGSSAVLVASGAFLLARTRHVLLQHAHLEAEALASGAAAGIHARLDRVAQSARLLAALAGAGRDDTGMLRDAMYADPDLDGLALARAPRDGEPPGPSPFIGRGDGGTLDQRDLRDDAGHFWTRPWFLAGLTCRDGCWQHPFLSQSRRRWLINYSVAVVRQDHAVALINADVTLSWLQDALAGLQRPAGAQAFVMDGNGHYLASDHAAAIGHRVPPDLRRALSRAGASPQRLGGAVDGLGEPAWLYVAPVAGTHWALAMLVPEARIYAPVRRLFLIDLAAGVLALLGIALIILLVTRRTLAPLGVLADRAERVARGDLEFALPPRRRHDEIGRLTEAFDGMRHELAEHIQQLTQSARLQQRLISELDIARQIQLSLLPAEHFVDDRHPTFEVHAALRPAHAVGGDLYSYFMLGSDHLCLMVGDVSDKGVPAALFMARTLTLAKALATGLRSPQDVLSRLNAELCEGNDSCMFVTLLCGVLDVRSGRLSLASAGHEPAILCNRFGTEVLQVETGPALGLDAAARYPVLGLRLQPGDTLVLYTDGITEATAASGSMYGRERLLDLLRRQPPATSPEGYTRQLLGDVDAFAGDASQTDDITVLALHWHQPEEVARHLMLDLTTAPRIEDVFAALRRCDAALEEAGIEGPVRADVHLVLEELMVNMVEHGYTQPDEGSIRLQLRLLADTVLIDLHDNGAPFNPLLPRPGPASAPRPAGECIGGLGLHLVRAMAGQLDYMHDSLGNHLQLRFKYSPPTEPAR